MLRVDRVVARFGSHDDPRVLSTAKFDELFKANASPVAAEAIQRIAWLYRIEADARELPSDERLRTRQERSRPLWEVLHAWLKLERTRVPDGSPIVKAIDFYEVWIVKPRQGGRATEQLDRWPGTPGSPTSYSGQTSIRVGSLARHLMLHARQQRWQVPTLRRAPSIASVTRL